MITLNGLRNIVVALAETLVAADLGILALALLHKSLELGVIGLSDCLGLHLHDQVAARRLDAGADVDYGFL